MAKISPENKDFKWHQLHPIETSGRPPSSHLIYNSFLLKFLFSLFNLSFQKGTVFKIPQVERKSLDLFRLYKVRGFCHTDWTIKGLPLDATTAFELPYMAANKHASIRPFLYLSSNYIPGKYAL